MSVETRDQRHKRYKKELDHIIKDVLDQEDDSAIEKALENHMCKSVLDIINATDDDINALDYVDDKGNVIELTIISRILLVL